MDIRPYSPADRDACLEIFDSNTPDLLSPNARPKFMEFLDAPASSFFIAEHNGEIAGCGGFEIIGVTARLHWGMVRRPWQRQGLGRFLLFYRLREITRDAAVEIVGLEAPRQAVPFFTAQGFREVAGTSEYAEMAKRLVVCA